jgi:prevent-host-death family protein
MLTVSLKDAKASLSSLVDAAVRGEFVTVTRDGRPAAALVSVEAAEIAREAMQKKRSGLVAYLRTFPGDTLERNRAPSRTVDL